jgi:hypothetical protein
MRRGIRDPSRPSHHPRPFSINRSSTLSNTGDLDARNQQHRSRAFLPWHDNGGRIRRRRPGCAMPIKLASPSLSPSPFFLQTSTHSSFTMAITRRQRKEISLGSSRHLRSRVVPYPQPAQKNARHLPLPPVPDRVISTNRHPQPQAVEIDEYVTFVHQSGAGSDTNLSREPNLHVLLGCEETGEPVRTQTGGELPVDSLR